MSQKKTQTFNEGVVRIYATADNSEPGNMPTDGLTLKVTLRYDERTVGIHRYNQAMQNDIKVDRLLRCPWIDGVSTQDIAIPIDEEQYEIKQVQYPKDVVPPSMDLSLEKVKHRYDIKAI